VTRVEVTLDGGETWQVCTLDCPEKPNKYGKYWCWCFWSVEVEVLDLLGAREIAVRAWDEALNTQPEKLIWNVMVRSCLCHILLIEILTLIRPLKFDRIVNYNYNARSAGHIGDCYCCISIGSNCLHY